MNHTAWSSKSLQRNMSRVELLQTQDAQICPMPVDTETHRKNLRKNIKILCISLQFANNAMGGLNGGNYVRCHWAALQCSECWFCQQVCILVTWITTAPAGSSTCVGRMFTTWKSSAKGKHQLNDRKFKSFSVLTFEIYRARLKMCLFDFSIFQLTLSYLKNTSMLHRPA